MTASINGFLDSLVARKTSLQVDPDGNLVKITEYAPKGQISRQPIIYTMLTHDERGVLLRKNGTVIFHNFNQIKSIEASYPEE